MSHVDLESLAIFLRTVELGSLSRAAKAHHMTQPSASARLHQLERQLGVSLLKRHPTGSKPTPAGLVLAQWGRRLLNCEEDFEAAAHKLRSGQVAQLRVSASYTIAEYLLPHWLSLVRAQGGLLAELRVGNSTECIARVRSGNADIGFIECPAPPDDMDVEDVAVDELVVVVPPNHPWTLRSGGIDPEVFRDSPIILRERGSGTRSSFEDALRPHLDGIPMTPLMELGSTTAVKSAVLDGMGPGVLSALAVEREIAAFQLVAVRIAGVDLSRRLRAVWPRGRATALGSALVDVAKRDSAPMNGERGLTQELLTS